MAEVQITLTNGMTAKVSPEDAEKVLDAGRWFAVKKHDVWYACRQFGRNNRVYLHRFILGASPMLVDHLNGDGLDNRRENLRFVNNSQNQRNRRGAERGSQSGIRGVHWHSQRSTWVAQIRVNGRKIHLGTFATKEAAHNARLQAESEHWTAADRYRVNASPKVQP